MSDNMRHGKGDSNGLIPMGTSDMSGQSVRTVNLRDLHAFLCVKSEFRNWAKNRIDDFGFVENQDFVTTVDIYRGGERRDYHATLDMAKELAMVERNEKGKQARLYFIECERRAKEEPAAIDVRNPSQLAQITIQLIEVNKELEQRAVEAEKVAEAATETVAAFDRIANADGNVNMTLAAKALQVSPHWFMKWCDTNGWTYKRGSQRMAYQDKVNTGYLHMKTDTVPRPDGSDKAVYQVFVTPKGLTKLAKLLGGSGGAPATLPLLRPNGLGGSAVHHAPAME